jgi:hypothetical protein
MSFVSISRIIIGLIIFPIFFSNAQNNTLKKTARLHIIPLTRLELLDLLANNAYTDISSTLTQDFRLPGQTYYELADKRLVVKQIEGNALVYKSLETVLNHMIDPSSDDLPTVPDDFLEIIPSLISKLSRLIKMQLTLKDNLKDLNKVDHLLQSKGWYDLDPDEYLLPLTAYCGQVMINETHGVWSMKKELTNESECHNLLFIKDLAIHSYDIEYDPYYIVMRDFLDAPSEVSFAGIIEATIRPNNFLKGINDVDRHR